MTYTDLWHRIAPLYGNQEAQAVIRLVLSEQYGLSLTDVVCGKVSELALDRQAELEKIMRRLELGEPVQYVLGKAEFCGRSFQVGEGVLIPRPETAQLCRMIAETHPQAAGILDIGTGSGCIAITLALDIPQAQVTAWDISPEALDIARNNAERLGAKVNFQLHDALQYGGNDTETMAATHTPIKRKYQIIVSNPPYIADKERHDMDPHVLGHEPHLALFVPDEDPLCFYHAIARYAHSALQFGGYLYFEINPLYAEELWQMLTRKGFDDVELIEDDYGKKRFVQCTMRNS